MKFIFMLIFLVSCATVSPPSPPEEISCQAEVERGAPLGSKNE